MGDKLTEAQMIGLRGIQLQGTVQCYPDDPFIRKMVALGYVTERDGVFLQNHYAITLAGIAAAIRNQGEPK